MDWNEAYFNSLLVMDHYLRKLDPKRRILNWRIQATKSLHRDLGNRKIPKPGRLPELPAQEVSAASFKRASRSFSHPVVIRGFAKRTRAARKWSLDYFRKVCGKNSYPVIADSLVLDPLTKQQKMTLLKMDDMLDSIEKGKGHQYMNNLTRIFSDHPQLIEDLEIDRLWGLVDEQSEEGFTLLNIFMGGGGTGTAMHCAFGGNFFSNIVGRKEWILIEPKYTKYLLPMPSQPFIFSDVYFDPGEKAESKAVRKLPHYRVVLEPGDVLFNAPWWWHRVANQSDFTIGCAVRHHRPLTDLQNNLLFTLMSISPQLAAAKAICWLKNRFSSQKRSLRDLLLAELDGEIYKGLQK